MKVTFVQAGTAAKKKEDLHTIEEWLRAQPRGAQRLDALIDRGVRLVAREGVNRLYVVCFGGKHRSAVVAALINARVSV